MSDQSPLEYFKSIRAWNHNLKNQRRKEAGLGALPLLDATFFELSELQDILSTYFTSPSDDKCQSFVAGYVEWMRQTPPMAGQTRLSPLKTEAMTNIEYALRRTLDRQLKRWKVALNLKDGHLFTQTNNAGRLAQNDRAR
jgi:hypothetical protein